MKKNIVQQAGFAAGYVLMTVTLLTALTIGMVASMQDSNQATLTDTTRSRLVFSGTTLLNEAMECYLNNLNKNEFPGNALDKFPRRYDLATAPTDEVYGAQTDDLVCPDNNPMTTSPELERPWAKLADTKNISDWGLAINPDEKAVYLVIYALRNDASYRKAIKIIASNFPEERICFQYVELGNWDEVQANIKWRGQSGATCDDETQEDSAAYVPSFTYLLHKE